MEVSSSDELSMQALPGAEESYASYSRCGGDLVALSGYIDDITAFLQRFNEHTNVHDIKIFLTSLERRAGNALHFRFHRTSRHVYLPADTHSNFSLQFGKVMYGTLCVQRHPDHPHSPAFPLSLAPCIARLCGWLFYTCEQSMFSWSYQPPELSMQGTLTKREREILVLMCRGYQIEDIAHTLTIASATVIKHKQHIYGQLGVHNVRDAIHVAYSSGLMSFLDELYE